MLNKYRYMAWQLEGDVPIQGIEEEILSTSKETAIRTAWIRARSELIGDDCDSFTIRLDYVELIEREVCNA